MLGLLSCWCGQPNWRGLDSHVCDFNACEVATKIQLCGTVELEDVKKGMGRLGKKT